jgi:hypothetical protein
VIKLGGKVKSQARNVSFSLKNGGLSGKNVTFAAERLRVSESRASSLVLPSVSRLDGSQWLRLFKNEAGTKVIKEILSWQYQLQTYQY